MLRQRQGQSFIEYTVLIIVLIAGILVMQNYIKRGFQGRYKSSVDDFGEQYDPKKVNGVTTYSLISNSDSAVQIVPGTQAGIEGFYTNRIDQTNSIELKQSNVMLNREE